MTLLITRGTSSAENRIREIRQELSTIPEYLNADFIAGKSTSLQDLILFLI